MKESILHLMQITIGILMLFALVFMIGTSRQTQLPLVLLAIGVTSLVGCCVPCRTTVCQCSPAMPTRWVEPPRVYGEPMHPILREDGQTVLMPHTKFQNWIRDDPAETSSEAGKSFGP